MQFDLQDIICEGRETFQRTVFHCYAESVFVFLVGLVGIALARLIQLFPPYYDMSFQEAINELWGMWAIGISLVIMAAICEIMLRTIEKRFFARLENKNGSL